MSKENKEVLSVYQKLAIVQAELKAPKNQFNSFGKYKYRSLEDIQEGLKPILKEVGAICMLSDSVELIGERYYIKATARFICADSGVSIEVSALARESLTKKGMDDSQITGTASSYARKYAMNGLFAIDDTKDADTDQHKQQEQAQPKPLAKKYENMGAEIGKAVEEGAPLQETLDSYRTAFSQRNQAECDKIYKTFKESVNG